MDKYSIISFLSVFLISFSFTIVFTGLDSHIGEPVPCVDGLNRINLEGLMCEDEIETWYGIDFRYSLLMLTPMILGLVMFTYSFNRSSIKNE